MKSNWKNKIFYFTILIFLLLFSSCTGCSKSGRRNINIQPTHKQNQVDTNITKKDKTTVKMEKKNGVYEVPVEINGEKLYFIFDTGAYAIFISSKTSTDLLKKRRISEEDFTGTKEFIDANGDVNEGVIVILKNVKIGDRVLNNIEASVTKNQDAPLLLGQTALEKFGKITIDYNKEILIFE